MTKKYEVGRSAIKTLVEAAITNGVDKDKIHQFFVLHGREDFFENSKYKYANWSLFNDIFQEFIKTIQKQGQSAFELAAYYGIHGKNISTYKNYVRSSWGTHYLYKLQEKIVFKLLFPFISMKVIHCSSDGILIRKSIDKEIDGIENLWEFYKEVYRYFPNILGNKAAAVDMLSSSTECYFLVTLPKGKSVLSNLTLGLNSFFNKVINIKNIFNSEKEIIQDLVEFKSELEEMNDELEKKNISLGDELTLKSELLDIFSHDMNNSLQIVNFYSNNLAKSDDPSVSNKAQKVFAHAKKLEEVMTYIRDFNKGLGTMTTTYGTLASILVEQTLDKFTEHASKKNILFNIEIEDDFEIFINDRAFSHSVLGNLVSNSIKFSEEGGTIDICASKSSTELIFSVRDYGIGMSPSEVKLYNEKNSRWTRSGTKDEVGTGIGSRICRALVKRVDGRLEVISSNIETENFARGTEVRIYLPNTINKGLNSEREVSSEI